MTRGHIRDLSYPWARVNLEAESPRQLRKSRFLTSCWPPCMKGKSEESYQRISVANEEASGRNSRLIWPRRLPQRRRRRSRRSWCLMGPEVLSHSCGLPNFFPSVILAWVERRKRQDVTSNGGIADRIRKQILYQAGPSMFPYHPTRMSHSLAI